MAATGAVVTYAEFEAISNRLAHLLRDHGLRRLDHYSIFMQNNDRYLESCGAGERSGLHYTCVNSHLTADELAYIIDNSESQVLITSRALFATATTAMRACPKVTLCRVVDAPDDVAGSDAATAPIVDFEAAVSGYSDTPIDDEYLGTPMLYSSGTTGHPKGSLRDLPECPPSEPLALFTFLTQLWRSRDEMIYLSPAPLYHSAPQAAVGLTPQAGGTAIIMEKFDPEQYLELVERYRVTHSQLVPTMFSRMLKLPTEVRTAHDLSSLATVVHAEASSPDGSMSTVGDVDDVGHVDDVGYVDDGYLYLTDRKAFMIISGGVNISPQEAENLLITHPLVADAAVFGVPNVDLGEEVKAVVQLAEGVDAGPTSNEH